MASQPVTANPMLPVLAILAANAAVHCVWLLADRGMVPASWPVRHLEVSAPNLLSRPWCALLALFSHQRTGHMVWNSLVSAVLSTVGCRHHLRDALLVVKTGAGRCGLFKSLETT